MTETGDSNFPIHVSLRTRLREFFDQYGIAADTIYFGIDDFQEFRAVTKSGWMTHGRLGRFWRYNGLDVVVVKRDRYLAVGRVTPLTAGGVHG